MDWGNDNDIIELLQRADAGYKPTESEMIKFSEIKQFALFISAIPKSIALLKNLEFFILDNESITDINALASLSNLEKIYIFSSQIEDISPLSQLNNLKTLSIHNTPIKNLNAIATLQNLQGLQLSVAEVDDISFLSELKNLKTLTLINTKVSNLDIISSLTQLISLQLNGKQITNIDALYTLKNLEDLDLSHTNIHTLPDWVRGLKNLKYLDLSHTNIHTIPDWIGDLKKLQALNLSEMNLHSIPQKLLQLNLPFSFEDLHFANAIQLYDTKLATQPISLFMQPREMIEAYYESEQVAINEAKVIFLGDGGVGKTHTIKRIKNDGKKDDYETKTTSGVDIINYWAKTDTKQFNINFWDFGGQEIMHAMHRCFLTERTCYVVVLSNRADLTSRARYWLKNIQSFAPGARVLLAVNKWDNIQSGGLDMNRLIQDYDNLCDTPIYYSAKNSNDDDFNLLTKAIIREASKLDSTEMRFPVQWANIRRELQIEAQNHHYIDKQKYHNICKTYGLESPDIRTWLLEWFNDLGICFSYHQGKEKNGNPVELDSYKVLNPKWLTNAIYIIINHGKKYADHGKLHINNISQLLQTPELGVLKNVTYKDREISYVLDVMRKFTLSYKISSSHEFIPALCEENTPEQLHPEDYPHHISYQMKYTYLPDSVVHQLMIRSYKNLNPEKIWRKGLRIDIDYVGLSAVVYMLDDDSTLRIDVYSHGSVEPWILLNNIRHDLISINSNLGLKAKDEIIIRDHDFDIVKSVNELLSAKEQGIDKYPLYNEKTNRTIFRSVDEILGITFGEENMKAIEKQAAEKNQPLAQTFAHCTIKEVNIYPQSPKQATPDAMEIINVLVQQQGDILDKAISCLIQEFEKSEDKETEKLLTEVKKDSGKGALQKIDEFLKRTANIGDNMKKTYKAGKGVAAVIKSAWPVIIAKCPEILEHLEHIVG